MKKENTNIVAISDVELISKSDARDLGFISSHTNNALVHFPKSGEVYEAYKTEVIFEDDGECRGIFCHLGCFVLRISKNPLPRIG